MLEEYGNVEVDDRKLFMKMEEMDLQMWAVVLGDFLYASRRTPGKVSILLGDESTSYQY